MGSSLSSLSWIMAFLLISISYRTTAQASAGEKPQEERSFSYFERPAWDQIIGEAKDLSETERLARLKLLITPYLSQAPEFHFSWGSKEKIKNLSDKRMNADFFGKIYQRSSHLPKGYYISTDPFDSEGYGQEFNVIRLPKNGRTFVNLMAIVPLLARLGYLNVASALFYLDLAKIGVHGAIWGGKTWSFLIAPVPESEIWSATTYKEFLRKNPRRLEETYQKSSLEKAFSKIQELRCSQIFH